MLLIEHHVPLVLSVCDHIYVLNFGRLLAEGEPSVIQTHPEVVAAYLGGEAPDALQATEETADDAALDAQTAHHEEPSVESVVDEEPTEVLETAPNMPAPRRTTKSAAPRRPMTAAEQREARQAAAKRPAPRKRTTR
jgi:ABC-type methionine transport system ATPase subunit